MCALFNPKIEIAKKEWSIAKDQESIAAIKPPSSIGFDAGREGNNQDKSKKHLVLISAPSLKQLIKPKFVKKRLSIKH